MASTKSLFLAGLALAAAVFCVDSSPLVEINRSAPVEVQRGNFVAGQREPNDYLSRNMAFSESHSSSGAAVPLKIQKTVQLYPGEVITQISVIDQSSDGATKVSIAAGGPGQQGAVLVFENPRNVIQVVVQVYAKYNP